MFRRRGFVRPFGRPIMSEVPPALRRANTLMANGDYPGAAQAFEDMARVAVSRNGPRAPLLLCQAGRMHILSGQVDPGMAQLEQGLGLFATRGQWQKFNTFGNRIVAELSERGLAEQAVGIQTLLKAHLPGGFVPATNLEKTKVVLPTNCPGCGAPIHASEVEWTDEITAECPFCGSAVRTAV